MLYASDYDKSKYLRAEDVKKPTKFRIKEVTEEVLNNKKTGKPENKPVVWFTTVDQGLVLNKTNNRTIRGAFGDLLADWKDKIIIVFSTATEMGPGLRVRIPPPKQAAPQQPVARRSSRQRSWRPLLRRAAPQQTPIGNGANA